MAREYYFKYKGRVVSSAFPDPELLYRTKAIGPKQVVPSDTPHPVAPIPNPNPEPLPRGYVGNFFSNIYNRFAKKRDDYISTTKTIGERAIAAAEAARDRVVENRLSGISRFNETAAAAANRSVRATSDDLPNQGVSRGMPFNQWYFDNRTGMWLRQKPMTGWQTLTWTDRKKQDWYKNRYHKPTTRRDIEKYWYNQQRYNTRKYLEKQRAIDAMFGSKGRFRLPGDMYDPNPPPRAPTSDEGFVDAPTIPVEDDVEQPSHEDYERYEHDEL